MRFQFLCFALIAALLVSCGGGDYNESQTSQTAPPLATPANAQEQNEVSEIIVKFDLSDPRSALRELNQEMTALLSQSAGQKLSYQRTGANNAHVLKFGKTLNQSEASQVLERLIKAGGLAYAEPNRRMYTSLIPNDTNFSSQWHLVEPEKVLNGVRVQGAVSAVAAWDITQGAQDTIVAVVDTGVLQHVDIKSHLLPGYDFVSNTLMANDGNGRDNNASDPGDWISATELSTFGATAPRPSSFHGTHVAGIIAAHGNNGFGVTGVSWNARILPVRVLGKGGGTTSDIADGIMWAAGGAVPGVPVNPYPAKIINLSLGGTGSCLTTTQNAINFARSRGITIIVAAGNEDTLTSSKQPANCQGVITVGSVGRTGTKSSFSNYGSNVAISAPGGDADGGILSLGDDGKQAPLGNNALVTKMGTSMATPVVSGIAALMRAVNPALTPDEIKSILQYTSSAFPTTSGNSPCTARLCGSGIVNALSAVRAASTAKTAIDSGNPQSGWWYQGATEGGRGYAIEIHNNSLFMAGFTYQEDGRATWFVSTGAMTDALNYSGDMVVYGNGQTLDGAFKPASQTGGLGKINISFNNSRTGKITWPNGQTMNIVRYGIPGAIDGASTVQTGFMPEAGWWWNQVEGGRGFAIEVQGDNLFIAGFMYDVQGRPVWYVSWGKMTSEKNYSGQWMQFADGQFIGGEYRSPTVLNANVAPLSLIFSDGRNAILTLPNGRTTQLSRYLDYGIQTPIQNTDANLERMTKILGQWNFSYWIKTLWSDDFVFNTIYNSEVTQGRYVAAGFNQYDRLTIAFYYESLGSYVALTQYPASEGYTFDDFYSFNLDNSGAAVQGCYYLAYHDDTVSRCYPLSGTRTSYAYDKRTQSRYLLPDYINNIRSHLQQEAALAGTLDKISPQAARSELNPSSALIRSLRKELEGY